MPDYLNESFVVYFGMCSLCPQDRFFFCEIDLASLEFCITISILKSACQFPQTKKPTRILTGIIYHPQTNQKEITFESKCLKMSYYSIYIHIYFKFLINFFLQISRFFNLSNYPKIVISIFEYSDIYIEISSAFTKLKISISSGPFGEWAGQSLGFTNKHLQIIIFSLAFQALYFTLLASDMLMTFLSFVFNTKQVFLLSFYGLQLLKKTNCISNS